MTDQPKRIRLVNDMPAVKPEDYEVVTDPEPTAEELHEAWVAFRDIALEKYNEVELVIRKRRWTVVGIVACETLNGAVVNRRFLFGTTDTSGRYLIRWLREQVKSKEPTP
jgi:hypothetical protein